MAAAVGGRGDLRGGRIKKRTSEMMVRALARERAVPRARERRRAAQAKDSLPCTDVAASTPQIPSAEAPMFALAQTAQKHRGRAG